MSRKMIGLCALSAAMFMVLGIQACGDDGCSDLCPQAGDLQCQGTVIQSCALAADGCLAWTDGTDCATTGQVCDGSGAAPECEYETLPLEDASVAFATELCARSYACCTAAEMLDLQDDNWTDEPSCITYWAGLFDTFMSDPAQAAVTAGRGVYHADEAADCLNAFSDRGCAGDPQNDFAALFQVCDPMYDGLQAIDAACHNAYECAGSLPCVGATQQVEGTCEAYLTESSACTPNSQPPCALDLFCDVDTCRTKKAAGTACTADSECMAGTKCVGDPLQCTTTVIDKCDGQ